MNSLKEPTVFKRTMRQYIAEPTRTACDCCNCQRKYNNSPVDYDRIRALAVPKYINPKFVANPDAHQLLAAANRHVPFEREGTVCQRTEQLALPRVRVLTSTKEEFRPVLGVERSKVLNMHIQKSLHTLYSRLANIPMPPQTGISKDTINWEQHRKWLESRALPKNMYHPNDDEHEQHISTPRRPINYHHLDHLAQPKHRPRKHPPVDRFAVKPAALKYEMTDAMTKLTEPIVRKADEPIPQYERPFRVPPPFRRVKSLGIDKLSAPMRPRKFFAKGDNASIVFTVSKAACKHKASARTKVICKPKRMFGAEPKKDPYKVSPAALTAKQPKKTIEFYKKLSTPPKKREIKS